MLKFIRTIDWKALFYGLFVSYFLLMILEFFIASLVFEVQGEGTGGFSLSFLNKLIWWFLAPVSCGYLVARLATRLPQLTVLLTILLGFSLQSTRITTSVWWFMPSWAFFSVCGGAFGAFLWRLNQGRRS